MTERASTSEVGEWTRQDWIDFMNRPHKEVCPSCDGDLMGPTCHFTYSTWQCLGCGATLDSRVVTPKTIDLDSPSSDEKATP